MDLTALIDRFRRLMPILQFLDSDEAYAYISDDDLSWESYELVRDLAETLFEPETDLIKIRRTWSIQYPSGILTFEFDEHVQACYLRGDYDVTNNVMISELYREMVLHGTL